MNVYYEGNKLYVDDCVKLFVRDIGKIAVQKERVIVLLKIPIGIDELDNVFAVSKTGVVLWRIESLKQKRCCEKPFAIYFPYETIHVDENEAWATDFYGRRVFFDTVEGKILKVDYVK